MASFIIFVQLLALYLTRPFESYGIKAFQDPESPANPFIFIAILLVFTAFIFLLVRLRCKRLIHAVIMLSVVITIFYVFVAIFPLIWYLPVVLTAVVAFILYRYPRWYIIDGTGLIIGGGVAAIFGISLGIVPVLILLVALAIYDAISVYKTRHMISLADIMIDLRAPVLFIIPKTRKAFKMDIRKEKLMGAKSFDVHVMGLGDAVIPSLLVVSANIFVDSIRILSLSVPSLGAMIGTLFGYFVLISIRSKSSVHAGLPFLNTGAIIGFLIGCLISACA